MTLCPIPHKVPIRGGWRVDQHPKLTHQLYPTGRNKKKNRLKCFTSCHGNGSKYKYFWLFLFSFLPPEWLEVVPISCHWLHLISESAVPLKQEEPLLMLQQWLEWRVNGSIPRVHAEEKTSSRNPVTCSFTLHFKQNSHESIRANALFGCRPLLRWRRRQTSDIIWAAVGLEWRTFWSHISPPVALPAVSVRRSVPAHSWEENR